MTSNANQRASVALAIKIAKDLHDDKLSMGNFEPWSQTLKDILEDITCGEGDQEQTVWATVINDQDENADPQPANNASAARKARYKQGASFAKQIIERTVDAANKSQIRNKTPHAAWTHLRKLHRSRAPANLSKIEEKMNTMSISHFRKQANNDEEQASMLYTSAMADLHLRYIAAGGTMDESAVYYKIVRNLPREYKNHKDQLLTKENDLTFPFISSFLTRAAISVGQSRQEEHRREGRDDALLTSHKKKDNNNNKNKSKQLCNNFLRNGKCRYGSDCRYMHLTEDDIARLQKHIAKRKDEANMTIEGRSNNEDGKIEYADDLY